MRQGFQGHSGQVQLFFGNKADAPLGRLICAVPPQPLFAFQLGPVPPYIEPKKQVCLGFRIRGYGLWSVPPYIEPKKRARFPYAL